MEPVGLAVGVLGLAGLFSATLDAVERFESWRNFKDESHLVRTLLEGQKLRLRLWGSAVGFDDGDVSSNHHEALDDPQIRSMIRTHLSDIKKLCTSADAIFLSTTGAAATRKDLHAWLLGPQMPNGIYEDAVQKRVDGTCDWILTRRLFLDWTAPDFPRGQAKILWINGAAGFGKTVLCARVVEHLCSTLDPPPAYFFFSSDFESWRDPFVAVRSWLTQVLSHTVAFDLVQEEWESQSDPTASQADVVKVFRKIVQAGPSFTFVLDGLDECAGAGQAWDAADSPVTKFLETIQQAVANTPTRIMTVSRGVPEIRQSILRNQGATWFDYSLSYDDVRTDTESYARSIVEKKLHNKDEIVRDDISLRLAERCKGQFLWVKLQEPSLRSGRNKKQLEAAIDTSPAAVHHLYDREWQRLLHLPTWESSRAVSLLRWAAFSLHPLTVAEITEALLIHEDCEELLLDEMPDSIDQDYIDGEILGLCGSLLEIRGVATESSVGFRTVHLAHFSVKEFFISRLSAGGNTLVANESLRNSCEATQHNTLAILCLRYVNFRSVWSDQHEEPNQVARSFLNYAAGSWYKHAAVSKSSDNRLIRLLNEFFSESNQKWQRWRKWYGMSSGNADEENLAGEYMMATPLYYAAQLGLKETVKYLINERRCSINAITHPGTTELEVNCILGNTAIVAMLLDAGAEFRTVDNMGWTPLISAAGQGHVEMAKLLLTKGADSTTANDYGWTPLHLAILSRHVEIVRLLLESKVDITAADDKGRVPLYLAVFSGHVEIVRLLLESRADINAAYDQGCTPLHLAVLYRHIEVAKLLLENGSDINPRSDGGWTPLLLAASNAHFEMVKLLLENGADITISLKSSGKLVPHLAAKGASIKVVELLLENGADVMARDFMGWTPLHVASYYGHADVAKLLLAKGSLVDVMDYDGRSAFFYACARGHLNVVQHVSFRNVATTTDRYGATPLFAATRNGQEHVVAYLLAMECDHGGLVDGLGQTLLWWASKSGNSQVFAAVLQLTKNNGVHGNDNDLAVEIASTPLEKSSTWCNCCTRHILEGDISFACSTCLDGDFDLCWDCFDSGARCHDASHELFAIS
ncbi:hypothetical protein LLEC1_04056 [Akanthomyces lecanii]|uniref:NACHT domain-containing protein n=1 Tax=Cordyceps confragosa TaxID=2714763 RepID=A0A179I9H8_CORDF|nr:hypothetical protein LLEC1_04056 [Akanthomyces lecanii]